MLDDSLLKKIDDALSCRFLIGDINFSNEEKEAIRFGGRDFRRYNEPAPV